MTARQVDADVLLRVYAEASYCVQADGSDFLLRVGHHSPRLARLMSRHACDSAAFLTAHNPGSVRRSALQNRIAQRRLALLLAASARHVFAGVGRDPEGSWPDEPSLLALGLARRTAVRIARQSRQLALLWCDRRAVPELMRVGDCASFRGTTPA